MTRSTRSSKSSVSLKAQQIELKKDATAAAAALPTFEYRPGNGLNIEAADKSWGVRFTIESHFRYSFESGRDQVGRSQGELMGRRFRPGVFIASTTALWEIEATLDLDGWGTGNGKNATGTTLGSILQRGAVNFHAEDLHPWLPTVQFGMEVQNAAGGSLARQGSGSTGAQAEYDLHTRNNGFNTGRAGQGIVLNWDDRSLSAIGIPGRIGKFQIGMSSIAEGDDGLASFTDRKDFNTYLSIQPFSQIKNKWISGLTFEYGSWFCNVDDRAQSNGCARYRVQDHGDGGRQTLFDTGADSIGDGTGNSSLQAPPGHVYRVDRDVHDHARRIEHGRNHERHADGHGDAMKRSPQRGQAVAEFALTLTVFLMLLMAVFDLGRGIYEYNGVAQAAREIARATSVHPGTSLGNDSATLAVIATEKRLIPNLGDPTFTCVDIDGTAIHTATTCVAGDQVRVQITAPYSPVTPLLGLVGTWNMQSTSSVAIQ